MSIISENIAKNINPSITLLIDAKAKELKAKGYKVISLGVGEPDFDTPYNIKLAAIKAINSGYTKYTEAGGTPLLKEAIINKLKRENNLEYNKNQILVSAGAKQSIYNAFVATLNFDDEVIIVAPYWVSYPEMVKIAGGKPVIVKSNLDNNFSLNIKNIENAISKKTKWLIINSPSNPSGVVYTKEELEELAKILLRHKHVHVLSDDIYEHLVFDQHKFLNLAQTNQELKNRVLVVNGVSKAYAMTGWRIGYAAGSEEIIKAMGVVQSQSTSSPCSISQMAAVEALNGDQDFISLHKRVFEARRNMTVSKFNNIPGLYCDSPKGSFYLFVNCSSFFGKKIPDGKIINSSFDFANYLMEQVYVAVVDGSSFGCEGYFRVSYTNSEANLQEAMQRIANACSLIQ
jgi:aspartate aminotransferase